MQLSLRKAGWKKDSVKMQRGLSVKFVLTFCFIVLSTVSAIGGRRHVKLLTVRSRMMLRRVGMEREDLKPKICFDRLGCFSDPPPHLSLRRPPESPSVIQTRFFLYTREERNSPESLEYSDALRSIRQSRFNSTKPLKVVIHGYKGSGSDTGTRLLMQALLDLEDANILVVDWTRGAANTYATAVANTELVGRQLGLILLDAISLGVGAKGIHVIGFSLGAHIAGCASEVLKKRNLLLGRISGLDPASPFFRRHLFREKSRKLDATDALLVDVIHTDGSEDFTDGFGLLKPLGHVDFFPNGGRQQPGCVDVKNSVVVSHLKEDALNRDIACSHLRAWVLFLESITAQGQACKFTAWPCPQGGNSYMKGLCFPTETISWSQEMGYGANHGPLGIYYLSTRESTPFCGQPLRASVATSEGAPKTSGILFVTLLENNSTTTFKIRCVLPKRRNEWTTFYNVATAMFQSLPDNSPMVEIRISYHPNVYKTEQNATRDPDSDVLLLNKLTIEDRKGNRWEHCSVDTAVNSEEIPIELYRERCTIP